MAYDIAIIGAGPGGYVAAIRAAQLGARVALIEKAEVGGVCLNWGCIPSKAIIACADKYNETKKLSKYGIKAENITFDYGEVYNRKNKIVEKIRKSLLMLLKNKGIDLIEGEADLDAVEFKHLIVATGSSPASLPGLEVDHEFILDSNDVLSLQELPESVLIVGTGAIGIEWARIFRNFDKQVTMVDIADRFSPMLDQDVSDYLEKLNKRQKIAFHKNTSVEKIEGRKVFLTNGMEIEPDAVIMAVGRRPNIDIKGIEKVENPYYIGDVTGKCQLAHAASHQGVKTVEHILLGKDLDINYNLIPSVIYGKPEVASVGYREHDLTEPYKKSVFPISALGRAQADERTDGFVKVLANEDKILGVHIVADNAGEMVQQATIAMNDNLHDVVFPHPTYSEAMHEAILGAFGEFLHI